jgi:hypothetical protein
MDHVMPATAHPLKAVAVELERMRADAVASSHPMLALLLQLARDEAREELAKRTAKPKRKPAAKASNVIRFPRKRLARRRNARILAEAVTIANGEVVRFADYATG